GAVLLVEGEQRAERAEIHRAVLVERGDQRNERACQLLRHCSLHPGFRPACPSPPALYSITSSAATRRACGIVNPSAFAVLRLSTNSNLVGRMTGRSAGLSPLRMRPA